MIFPLKTLTTHTGFTYHKVWPHLQQCMTTLTTMYDDNVWPHLAQCMSILTTIYDPIYDPTKLGHGCPKPDWGIIAGTHFLRIKFSEGLNIVAILIPSGFD